MVKQLNARIPNVKLQNGRAYAHDSVGKFAELNLRDFVSQKTKKFFTNFGLSSDFLQFDPSTWETNFDFEEGWSFSRDVFVINDPAERGVKFMKDYNKILTLDEGEKEVLLQGVEAYRHKYPSYNKSSLL